MNQDILMPLFSKHLKVRNIVSIDVETYGVENDFYLGGVYSDNGFELFTEKELLQEELLQRKYVGDVYIVATNLGFDFTAIYYGSKHWEKFKIIMVGSRMVEVVYEHQRGKIVFIDSLNYAQFSVKVMGEILGIPKLEAPSCLGKIPKNKKEFNELAIYNKRDCEVTYKFVKFLQEGFNKLGGTMKITVASTAMDTFRRKYLRFPLKKEVARLEKPHLRELMFKGYYGGRTEVFKRGKISNMKMYDINSLYPSVMLNDFPNPNYARHQYQPHKNILQFEGMSDVLLTTHDNYYPYLPVRKEKLLFPNGTIRGVYTHTALRKAIEQGYNVKKIYESLYYKKTFYPFKDYVTDLYDLRLKYKKEKSPMEIVVKLLLNSLYGKFAQRKMNDIEFFDLNTASDDFLDAFHNDEELQAVMTKDNKGFITTDRQCNQAFVFPMLSAYTTSYAQDRLFYFMEKYKAHYTDTDSIVTNKTMPESNKLGDMKVEYDINKGILVKPKMYMFETPNKIIVKMKGLPRATKEQFKDILLGNKVRYTKFSKLKESVRRNMKPNTIYEMEKSVSLEDNKREWESGFDADSLQDSEPLIVD